ncbi:MAG TPA: alkaline phosphatase family protein [Mycobacteriales bacterium]|nr:alkaline phosphatase family protein [Mycobacteriales bacterium]
MLSRSRLATVATAGLALVVGLAIAIPNATATGAGSRPAAAHPAAAFKQPPIKHVWIIVLENESFGYTFGKAGEAQAPYLTKTLTAKGALLTHYYGIGHDSLDNYTAMISGQNSNYELGQDCGLYEPFIQFGGENYDKWTPKLHQLSGEGCVYPKYVKTVVNQLTAKGLTWKAYEEDMGKIPSRDKTVKTANGPACGHPKLGGVDLTDSTSPKNDSYATRHDPFMYFKSITGDPAYCDSHVLTMSPLTSDLKKISTTPNYSFITPNTCADGHDTPKCQDGRKGGLPRVNDFLKKWIPTIMASPAYKKNGMIVINFDESGSDEDATACCGEHDSLGYSDPSHPNMNEPGLYGPGGGRVGAVVLSRYIKPGTVSSKPYNHFSLLRTIEDIFGLSHLGDARQTKVVSFGADVYTKR